MILTEGLFSKMAEKKREKKINITMSEVSGGKLTSADKSSVDDFAFSYMFFSKKVSNC